MEKHCTVGLDEYTAKDPQEAIKEFEELQNLPAAKEYGMFKRLCGAKAFIPQLES